MPKTKSASSHQHRRPLRVVAFALGLAVCAVAQAAPDAWTLHLVWSPDFCEANLTSKEPQCTEERYFTVDGLLPHFSDGAQPECSDASLSDEELERWMVTIPSRAQIKKTWKKQGACSGLDSAGYYTQLERASRRVVVPSEFGAVTDTLKLSRALVKKAFIDNNPGLTEESLVLDCRGRSLAGVNVCFDADFQYQACAVAERCGSSEVTLRPLRASRVGREPVYR
jgi:ribonuclease T2